MLVRSVVTVKLHLFKLPPDGYEFGHLFSDTRDSVIGEIELCMEAEDLELDKRWIQKKPGKLVHFDLWGKPLRKAKKLFPIVDNKGMRDILRFASQIRGPRFAIEVYDEY